MEKSQIDRLLAVTCEVIGAELTPAAVRVIAKQLEPYPEQWVTGSLRRCMMELSRRLTLADIIARLDDGRPGPEEAWAMLPRDEASTVVWTQEMQAAWGVALPLMDDEVAARMAFTEVYRKAVSKARANADPVCWQPSLGTDPAARAGALEEAARLNRISVEHAAALLPTPEASPTLVLRARAIAKQLTGSPKTEPAQGEPVE